MTLRRLHGPSSGDCAAITKGPWVEPQDAGIPPSKSRQAGPRKVVRPAGPRARPQVVGIGISTGGPNALSTMLPMLPADFPLPILVVQHMPAGYTARLAESLRRHCNLEVREACDGEMVRPGCILIAPGGRQMRVVEQSVGVVVEITDDPPEQSCRPAVDYLFRSLQAVYEARTMAVIMTGMGEDGLASMLALAEVGATLVAQDEATCTVYGMPRGPIEAGIIDVTAPLAELAGRIVTLARR